MVRQDASVMASIIGWELLELGEAGIGEVCESQFITWASRNRVIIMLINLFGYLRKEAFKEVHQKYIFFSLENYTIQADVLGSLVCSCL